MACREASPAAVTGTWITPGLFDLQINGIAGINFTDASSTPDQLQRADSAIRAWGISRYCPTLITSSFETARAVIGVFAREWSAGRLPAAWAIHLEGPGFRTRTARGESTAGSTFGTSPCPSGTRCRQRPAGGSVFSPWPRRGPGALDLTRRASRAGTVVSLGHTAASAQEIAAAVAAGASMSTHLFNGCPRLLDRHTNVIYSQLSEDALYACFIADGHHVPYPTLRVGLRAKGMARSILVSDIAHLCGCRTGNTRWKETPWCCATAA